MNTNTSEGMTELRHMIVGYRLVQAFAGLQNNVAIRLWPGHWLQVPSSPGASTLGLRREE
jgi:hypothetical protein